MGYILLTGDHGDEVVRLTIAVWPPGDRYPPPIHENVITCYQDGNTVIINEAHNGVLRSHKILVSDYGVIDTVRTQLNKPWYTAYGCEASCFNCGTDNLLLGHDVCGPCMIIIIDEARKKKVTKKKVRRRIICE